MTDIQRYRFDGHMGMTKTDDLSHETFVNGDDHAAIVTALQEQVQKLTDRLNRSEDYSIGIDMERMEFLERVQKLAAENEHLKYHLKGTPEYCYDELPKTPATDAFIREIGAKAVDVHAADLWQKANDIVSQGGTKSFVTNARVAARMAEDYSAKLRAGEHP